MEMPENESTVAFEKGRMEALTDGVFAFAMTLLVTSMILPRSVVAVPGTSAAALVSLIPDFIHYIIAFFVLSGFWIAHHVQFNQIRHLNRTFLSLSMIGLFFVTLVPFSTSFVGDYPDDAIAAIVFEANLLILGMFFCFQWWYASRRHNLIHPEYPEVKIREAMHRNMVIPIISLVAIALALAGSDSSTLVYILIPPGMFLMRHFSARMASRS